MSPLPVRIQTSAGGVIYRQQGGQTEVALISVGEPPRWQLPKGTVDKGEEPQQTALREVREETGLEGELVGPVDEIEYWFSGSGRSGAYRIHKFVKFYLMRYLSGSTGDHDQEVNEARWFPLEEALGNLTFESERKILAKAKEMMNEKQS